MDFILGAAKGSYFLSQLECGCVDISEHLAPIVGDAILRRLTRAVYPTEPVGVSSWVALYEVHVRARCVYG